MSRANATTDQPEQPPSHAATAQATPADQTAPEQAAKAHIARRAKPSVVPGHVRLTFTLDLPREVDERLTAQAIREQRNIEGNSAHVQRPNRRTRMKQ